MAVNNSEADHTPPLPPPPPAAARQPPPNDVDLSQVGELMAMNIGLNAAPQPGRFLPPVRPMATVADLPDAPTHATRTGPTEPAIEDPALDELIRNAPPIDSHTALPRPFNQHKTGPTATRPSIEPRPSRANKARYADLSPQTGPIPTVHETTAPEPGSPSENGDRTAAAIVDALSRSPWAIVGAAVAVLIAVGTASWLVGPSGEQDESGASELLTTPVTTAANTQDSDASNGTNGSTPARPEATLAEPSLNPAAIPPVDQPGLIGLELDLFDPYTGRGTTGKVNLYLNAITGQICHMFDAAVIDTRYRAYIHEAVYPREGPSVVDLGETETGVPQCVTANPIELARIMTGTDDFYIAAHSPDREVLLRGQVSAAHRAFDNRDDATIASQTATAAASRTTPTTGADPNALFGTADDGAYLVVDAGRVTFEGAVPDAATASRLLAAFVPLAGLGVDVVDNLTVEPGAPAPSGRVVVTDALLFGSGQAQVEGQPLVLTTLADLLRVNPTWTVTITGHTDDVGQWLYNVELSLRRANNIRASLAEMNVPAERIRVQGAGPQQPIADNQTAEGRARNRRIEISISSG